MSITQTTRICPVTGVRSSSSFVPSSIREGVFISPESSRLEVQNKEWWVDSKKATKTLRSYFDLLYRYDVTYNCSDDRNEVARLEKRVEAAKAKRTPKFVVYVESTDGMSPLAEFTDENLALARVFGWLGRNYNRYGNRRWVSMYGSVIGIVHM